MMKIQFLGGAGTVTGSKTLITYGKHQVLVDCGLFQGLKQLRLKNWEPFPVDPASISSVLLTHAHLDHSGALPLLVKGGFRGKIYCSAPTRDLSQLILEDSARLHEEDADFANARGFSKHHPARPLYDHTDVARACERMETVGVGHWESLPGGLRYRFWPNGHILGSTWIEAEAEGTRVIFSGDLGRAYPLLYPSGEPPREADYVVVESTYGDRLHHPLGPEDGRAIQAELAEVVLRTAARGGKVLIPSFAVGRTQDVLHLLARLKQENRIPSLPVYLDSPMGSHATDLLTDHPRWHRLTPPEIERLQSVARVVRTRQESMKIMREEGSSIIIAGSGMLTGGRAVHHLASFAPDERHTILLVGYQAPGTRGWALREREPEIKCHGRYFPVRAEVRELPDLSAHADQGEILDWLSRLTRPPRRVFVQHGEPPVCDALRRKIQDALHWEAYAPQLMEEFELESSGPRAPSTLER